MSSNTIYLPQILNAISEAKTKKQKQEILLKHRNNKTFIKMIRQTYGPDKCKLSKGDVKRLLKLPYQEPYAPDVDMAWGNLYQGMIDRQLALFFDGGPLVKKAKLENIFGQLRETLHPREFQAVVDMLTKKNLAKGLTKKLVNETLPNLLPEKKEEA